MSTPADRDEHVAEAEVLLGAFRHTESDSLENSYQRDVEALYLQAATVHALIAIAERLNNIYAAIAEGT